MSPDNKYSPFVKCLRPRKIQNKYTNDYVIVPCGHCKACLDSKMSAKTQQCRLESTCCRYTMFVTLTYDNFYLPKLKVEKSDDVIGHITITEASNVVRPFIFEQKRYDWQDWQKLDSKFGLDGYIPYLSKRDLQLFIKRFRFLAKKRYNEQVRYYACGEYGPVHYRPHYHLLFFFNSRQLCEAFSEMLSSCWQYGRVDSSIAEDCSRYVAGYANSYLCVPSLLKLPFSKPFSCHSFHLGQAPFDTLKATNEIYEKSFEEIVSRRITFGSQVTTVAVPYTAFARFFPKCKSFASKSYSELLFSYRLYKYAQNLINTDSCMEMARYIFDTIILYGDTIDWSQHDVTTELLRYFRCSISDYDYMYRNTGIANSGYSDRVESIKINSEWATHVISNIYNELRVSRQFYTYCCSDIPDNDAYLVNRRLHRIVEFYKWYDFKRLHDRLDWLQDSNNIDPNNLEDWNTVLSAYAFRDECRMDIKDLYSYSPLYRQKQAEWVNRFNDSIKHKHLNDANNIFNYL